MSDFKLFLTEQNEVIEVKDIQLRWKNLQQIT
jgi:hypothetical protein